MLVCARLGRCRHIPSPAGPRRVYDHAGIFTSAVRRQDGDPPPPSEDENKVDGQEHEMVDEQEPEMNESSGKDITFEAWLKKAGSVFRHARPRNWLGGNVPFPLNPSFKPPTPVSDALRSHLFAQYMTDPSTNNARRLAARYGMSIKRVEAILRLKGLEQHWKKEGKQLQTGFVAGMERLLGVSRDQNISVDTVLGSDTTASDLQDEAEGDDRQRDRYLRYFWEPVVEGKEPTMPGVLENAREAGQRWTQTAEDWKSSKRILGSRKDNPPKAQLFPSGSSPGRPVIEFIDVGGKFIDVKEYNRRLKESDRRRRSRQPETNQA